LDIYQEQSPYFVISQVADMYSFFQREFFNWSIY